MSRRDIAIRAGRARRNAEPHEARSQENRVPAVSMWMIQVNSQQRVREGRSEQDMRDRMAATMNAFFNSDDYMRRSLNFHWEGDGMEQIQHIAVAGGVERGGSTGSIHGHFVVRILHTTNLGFASTHRETDNNGNRNPGYRPDGEELMGQVLAEVWNTLPDFPPWEPPLTNMYVMLKRINDPRSAFEYSLKDLDPEERLAMMMAFEETRGQQLAEQRAGIRSG